jgi:hypothetical protein
MERDNEFSIGKCNEYLEHLQSMYYKLPEGKEKSDLMLCILTTINIIEMLKGND